LKLAEDLNDLRKQIKKAGSFVFDTETSSFDRMKAKLVGISLAVNEKQAWYLPVRHETNAARKTEVLQFLKEIFEDASLTKIAHNLKYDIEILNREGIQVAGVLDDTMIEAHLLHADRRSFSLDNLARDFLGQEKGDLKKLLGESEDFSTIPLSDAVGYAAQDAHLTFELHQKFHTPLKEQPQVRWLYREVEIPLAQVLSKMESRGVLVDGKQLEKLSVELHKKITKLQTKIYEIAKCEFNIASPKQLQDILFNKLGLTPGKKTKTGFSTDESVLQDLAEEHELPKLILEVRGLSKLTSTYVDVLPTLISDVDGRLHTHYHQTGTATGRLSSSDPNLQNIPVRTEEGMRIREAFRAAKGFQLLSADYSQVELRLFAHMSEDANMIAAFQRGRDIHSETAKIIFGSDEKEFRSRAKAINFGIIYGISAFGLAKQLGISRSESAQFIDAYFEKFPKIKTFMESLLEIAKKNAYTETLFGRRRPIPDIHSKNAVLRQFAERIATNAPVQGTAADIMKAAMVRIEKRLEGMKSRMLLQVHDELVFEVADSEIEKVSKLVTEEMMDLSQTPIKKLDVPLIVDSAIGPSWASIN
jgi:DNA polymerase-1